MVAQDPGLHYLKVRVYLQDMDDVSILTAMSRNMMPGARESVGKSRTSTGKGRRNGAAGAKRSTNG